MADPDRRAHVESLIRRLIDDVIGGGRLEVIAELYTPAAADPARRWIEPFLRSFPDARMELVTLVCEGDTAVARFRCSGTHLGTWRGHPPTGRRFRVDEVYFFTIAEGRIAGAWGLEDTHRRLCQLGLVDAEPDAPGRPTAGGRGRRGASDRRPGGDVPRS